MGSIQTRLLVSVVVVMSHLPLVSLAQDASNAANAAEIEALEPAISSAELETVTTSEQETLEPAVSSADLSASAAADEAAPAVLAADVRRRENSRGVMDEIDLGRTEITGNQELPKVLYIVPWKKSDPGDLMGKPVNSLLDEVLAPIDRSEFIRQVDYYGDLYGEEEE